MSRLLDYVEYGQSVVRTSGGVEANDTGARLHSRVKREAVAAVRQILGIRKWDFMYRTGGGTTWPVIDDTTTATLTKGSRTVSLSDNVIHKGYERGIFEVTSTGEDTFRYPVAEVLTPSAFNLPLGMRWPYDTEASLSYRIWQPRYPLPYDMGSILIGSVRMEGVSHPLYRIGRAEIEYRYGSQGWSGGDPNRWIDDYWAGDPLWSHDISDPDGTINVTADSTAATGANMNLDNVVLVENNAGDVLEGWPIKVFTPALSYINGVAVVTGANALTLAQKFRGATGTTLKYEIGGQGTRMVEFYPPPERAALYAYLYYASFLGLYNDNDESPIPTRWEGVVNDLLAARLLFDMKGGENIQSDALAHLRAYKVQLEDMESEDHPHADHPGYLQDNGLTWEYFGLDPDFPVLAGYNYWPVSS
jgi:hypothetical protein